MNDKPRGFKARLKHAFAIEQKDGITVDEVTEGIIDRICREVVRRRMVTPALMLLEISRPLNYLGSQALHFFQPFASVLVDPKSWERFAVFLEQRGSVEFLIRRLEDLEVGPDSQEMKDSDEKPDPEAESELEDKPGGGGPDGDRA